MGEEPPRHAVFDLLTEDLISEVVSPLEVHHPDVYVHRDGWPPAGGAEVFDERLKEPVIGWDLIHLCQLTIQFEQIREELAHQTKLIKVLFSKTNISYSITLYLYNTMKRNIWEGSK